MASIKLYLDTRRESKDGTYRVKLAVNHRSGTAVIPTDIRVSDKEWDFVRDQVVLRQDRKRLNDHLTQRLMDARRALASVSERCRVRSLTAKELREAILRELYPRDYAEEANFKNAFDRFVATHENKRTRELYAATWVKIDRYDRNAKHLTFQDITPDWLRGFFSWLAETSPAINARNIHMRNIRAVFNDAIDNGLTQCYPFRRVKIRPTETARRNLTAEQMRKILSADVPPHARKYVDIFALSFLLIGINVGDLLTLPADSLRNGRIEFHRKKTHRLQSILVEPEAMEIIERYRGEEHLLRFCDGGVGYRGIAQKCNRLLSSIIPNVTTYWARHTWASIASELDIPEDTISRALGHATSGASVTMTYINYNSRKIDEANRRVIDYVFGKHAKNEP